MPRLDEAAERLQQALIQLETIIDQRDEGHSALGAALQTAKQENADLQRLASEVSDGIDRVVGHLKGVLEN